MSGLIKSGAGISSVRSFPLTNVAAVRPILSPEDEERERLRRKVDALEKELDSRDASLTKLRKEVDEAHIRGKSEGHSAGLADAGKRDADRLSLLEQALSCVGMELKQSLSSLERLAALLARDCLAIILGNPDYRHELLEQIIVAQIAKIEKSLLVEIELSAEDFPDAETIAAAADKAGIGAASLIAIADLPPGDCVMKLRLGYQEIGINQQWDVLRARLEELSQPEEPV
jgi:flagellar biosynthesis/type III secretory pathway protein FliH